MDGNKKFVFKKSRAGKLLALLMGDEAQESNTNVIKYPRQQTSLSDCVLLLNYTKLWLIYILRNVAFPTTDVRVCVCDFKKNQKFKIRPFLLLMILLVLKVAGGDIRKWFLCVLFV